MGFSHKAQAMEMVLMTHLFGCLPNDSSGHERIVRMC